MQVEAPAASCQAVVVAIGRERAAYSVQVECAVAYGARGHTLHLLSLPASAVFLSSSVEAPDGAWGVQRDGDDVVLLVPACTPGGTCTAAVTLHLSVSLWTREGGHSPSAVRLPVVPCRTNQVECTFHEHRPAGALGVRVRPSETRAVWAEGAQRFTAEFPSTHTLLLAWLPQPSVPDDVPLLAESAQTASHVSMTLAHVWDTATHAFVPSALLELDMSVTVHGAYTLLHADEALLTLDLDAMGQELVWDTVEMEPFEGGVFLGAGMHEMPTTSAQLALVGSEREVATPHAVVGSAKVYVRVNVAAVTSVLGEASTTPLRMLFKARCALALDAVPPLPCTLALPVLHMRQGRSHSHTYTLHEANARTPVPFAFQLELCAPLAKGQSPSRIVPGSTVRLSAHAGSGALAPPWEPCRVAFVPVEPAPQPTPALLQPTSVHHEAWPCAREHRIVHHLLLNVFGPMEGGAPPVLVFPTDVLTDAMVASLAAYINGHPVRALITPYTGPNGQRADELAAVALSIPDVAVRGYKAQMELSFAVPWSPSQGFSVLCPAPLVRVPLMVLKVHGSEHRVPRLVHEATADHITSAHEVCLTSFPEKPVPLRSVPFQLVRAPSAARSPWLFVVLGASLVLAFTALWYMHGLHRTLEELRMHTDVLAMALDVDFRDGRWAMAHQLTTRGRLETVLHVPQPRQSLVHALLHRLASVPGVWAAYLRPYLAYAW